MKLSKDKRWNAWPAINEEYFDSLAKDLALRPEVPDPVHRLIKQMQSVLRFCYFDYELIGITNLLSAIAFEAALRLKYQELEHREKKKAKINLDQLIRWGEKANLFEEEASVIQLLRKLRNVYAHPKDAMILGIMGIQFTTKTVNIINGLYDTRIDLRIQRRLKTERINGVLSQRSKEGVILHLPGRRLIVFDVRLLLYNNLFSEQEYYLWIYPIFEIPENATEVDEKKPIILRCNSIRFKRSGDGWNMLAGDAIISRLEGRENKEKFEVWLERLNSCKLPVKILIDQDYGELRNKLMSDKIYRWSD